MDPEGAVVSCQLSVATEDWQTHFLSRKYASYQTAAQQQGVQG